MRVCVLANWKTEANQRIDNIRKSNQNATKNASSLSCLRLKILCLMNDLTFNVGFIPCS